MDLFLVELLIDDFYVFDDIVVYFREFMASGDFIPDVGKNFMLRELFTAIKEGFPIHINNKLVCEKT